MTADLKVVELREGRPLLNDIPGQLRLLADRIEKGEQAAYTALVLINGDHYVPDTLLLGNAMETRLILGMLDLARHARITALFADDDQLDPAS